MTEQEKFQAWVDKQGSLVDIKISLARIDLKRVADSTYIEEIFSELNEISALIDAGVNLPHGDVF